MNVNENHTICTEFAVFYIYKISVVIINKPILDYFNYYDHLILVFYFLRLSPLKIFSSSLHVNTSFSRFLCEFLLF